MPDFVMCHSTICPIREGCRRSPDSGTIPWGWQSWIDFFQHYRQIGDDPQSCPYFKETK